METALPVSSISGFFFSPLLGRGIRFPLATFSLPQELENKTVAGVFPEQSECSRKHLTEGCFWQFARVWGTPVSRLGGCTGVCGVSKRGVCENWGNVCLLSDVCWGKSASP